MDKNLLSELLRELLTVNNRVSMPGMGSFITEISPSYFTDEGSTINPPYKKLYFRTSEKWNDALLETLYAEQKGVTIEESKMLIDEFISAFKNDLNSKKSIELPGLGIMRATNENNYFFVADDNLNLYVEAAGLDPISIKKLIDTDDFIPEDLEEQFPEIAIGIEQDRDQIIVEESIDQVEIESVETTPEEEKDLDELIVDLNEEFFQKIKQRNTESDSVAKEQPEKKNDEGKDDILELEEKSTESTVILDSVASETEIDENQEQNGSEQDDPKEEEIIKVVSEVEKIVEEILPDQENSKEVTQSEETSNKVRSKKIWRAIFIILLIVIAAIIIFALFYEEQFNQLLDRILYSSEELDLINRSL